MQSDQLHPSIIALGNGGESGSYILRIAVHQPLAVSFGRFKKGKPVAVPAGDCLYIGSALGSRGRPLARRLIRHATRSGDRPPHKIRADLLAYFEAPGYSQNSLLPKSSKKLHWHIDYLLDRLEVELKAVIAVKSPKRLETSLAQLLTQDRHTFIIEKGLGAGDASGNTHLLGIIASENRQRSLPERIERLL